jgi:hypothetical protein
VPGARTAANTATLVEDFRRRTEGRLMDLRTSADDPAYERAIPHAYGATVTPPRTGKPGRPKTPYKATPGDLNPAVVTTRREKDRVVAVGTRVVFGTVAAVLLTLALGMSKVSRAIHTAFVERENGTDRHRNARKARTTYRFRTEWRDHEAVTSLSLYRDNFRGPARTLAVKDDEDRRVERSPAMAAELTDHVWSRSEWLSLPAVRHC